VDRPRLIAMINAAFAIETFLEGARTDKQRFTAMMRKGEILLDEDNAGVWSPRSTGLLVVDPHHQRARTRSTHACSR
jgi:hypothetical protein